MIQPITSGVLHARPGLDARPGSDLPPKPHVLVHSFAAYQDAELPPQATRYKLVHLCALKLQVLQRCGATSESYTLQTGLVHSRATYALTLHVRVRLSRPTKDAELPPQGRPGAKGRGSTVSRLLLSPYASLLIFFPAHLPGTTNGPQQATAPSGASPAT